MNVKVSDKSILNYRGQSYFNNEVFGCHIRSQINTSILQVAKTSTAMSDNRKTLHSRAEKGFLEESKNLNLIKTG